MSAYASSTTVTGTNNASTGVGGSGSVGGDIYDNPSGPNVIDLAEPNPTSGNGWTYSNYYNAFLLLMEQMLLLSIPT
jgi:hypothetical protein